MPLVLGVDLGTTKITALALDCTTGAVVVTSGAANDAETTSAADKSHGYSEWDATRVLDVAFSCVRNVAAQLANRIHETAGIGITGQQHGGVLVDANLTPLTPFINWQDRRANQIMPGSRQTYVARAMEAVGRAAPSRAGCRLAAGYLGVTLFWLKSQKLLPTFGTACFLMDLLGARLTGGKPVTDATCAASSGIFNVAEGDWDTESFTCLGLSKSLVPDVRPSGALLGGLASPMAETLDLPSGLPIFAGIGDNQASFIGSVGNPYQAVLVNVGTGGQVAAHSDRFAWDPLLETRPFPRGGYLLVSAGLCGGASYAVLERFVRQVGAHLGKEPTEPLYPMLNRLAAEISPGANGLHCQPFFAGTRAQPELRASWTGVSMENFTLAHMARALLEGMARSFRAGHEQVASLTGQSVSRLVGAGNGLRENPVLAALVADAFGLPLEFPRHHEEAAYGAALLAAVGAGLFPDLQTAGKMIRH